MEVMSFHKGLSVLRSAEHDSRCLQVVGSCGMYAYRAGTCRHSCGLSNPEPVSGVEANVVGSESQNVVFALENASWECLTLADEFTY